MGKNNEVTIKYSDEEKEKVRKKAEELSMPLSTYIRFISLNARVKQPETP